MDTSFFLAKIFGFALSVIGLGMLLNLKHYQKMLQSFLNSAPLVYLGGFIAFVLGLLVVLIHNVWEGWAALITILGWLTLLKGALYLLVPQGMMNWKKSMCTIGWCTFGGILTLVLGAYLLYSSLM